MRGLLVVNPHATTTSPRVTDVLVQALSRELDLEVTVTTHKGHGIEIGERARIEGLDIVVTLGGDGIIHEVVNGLLAGGVREGLPRLAIPVASALDARPTAGSSRAPALALTQRSSMPWRSSAGPAIRRPRFAISQR